MKNILTLLFTVCVMTFCITITGCSESSPEDPSPAKTLSPDITQTEPEPLITREQIVEHFGLEPSALDGIDVEGIIKRYQLTRDYLEAERGTTTEAIVSNLRSLEERMNNDLQYLFEGGTPEAEIQVTDIKRVVSLVARNELCDYWLIDLSTNKAYYAVGNHKYMNMLEEYAEETNDLSSEDRIQLLAVLKEACLHQWEAVYEPTAEELENRERGWRLGIEMADGTVYSWRSMRGIWGAGIIP